MTTTSAGQLVLGLIAISDPASVTAGGGFTVQDQVPAAGTKLATIDQRQVAAGTIAATATLGVADAWGALMATFRAGTAGPPPPADLT